MHDIEPYHKWRAHYIAAEDNKSPFFGKENNLFTFTNKVYNYFIHPEWDEFGSSTLYLKVIFVDYDDGFAIMELIGEWNDCISNDIMFLKRRVVDALIDQAVTKFIVICENVLNFHGSDDAYYEEWYEDICEEGGWVCMINTLDHVFEEMGETRLYQYVNFGPFFNDLNWRPQKPKLFCKFVEQKVHSAPRFLSD